MSNLEKQAAKHVKPIGIDGCLRMIVNRCNVGESYRDVIRTVEKSLKTKSIRSLPKDKRRYLIAAVIVVHAENRALYRSVMGGRSR